MKSLNVVLALMTCGLGFSHALVAEDASVNKPQKHHKVDEPPVAADRADRAAALQANGQFAIDLYQELAQTDQGKNVFVSPFSISIALTMATDGAVDQTLQQMTDVLHIPAGDLARIHRSQGKPVFRRAQTGCAGRFSDQREDGTPIRNPSSDAHQPAVPVTGRFELHYEVVVPAPEVLRQG